MLRRFLRPCFAISQEFAGWVVGHIEESNVRPGGRACKHGRQNNREGNGWMVSMAGLGVTTDTPASPSHPNRGFLSDCP